jgi:hypothetical protein
MGMRHKYMPEIYGESEISTDYVGEVVGMTIEQCLRYYFYDLAMGSGIEVVS